MGVGAGGDARARSACPAAATAMRSARIANYGQPRQRRAAADPAAGPQRRRATSSRSRASPTCCSIPATPFDYNGQRLTYPDIRWSTGPAAIRSTTIRISTGCAGLRARRHAGRARARPGPRRRATPISCCPATMTLEREDIGAHADRSADGRDAPASPSRIGEARDDYDDLRRLAERLGCARGLHRGPHARRLAATSLRADPRRRWRPRASTRPTSTRSGQRGELRAAAAAGRRRHRCAPSATTRRRSRCRRRAARSRSSPRRSPASAMPTAPAIRPGCRRRTCRTPARIRCSWSPTSRRRGCTASSISAATARPRSIAAASRRASTRPTPRRAASPTATSSACSTIAAPASPAATLSEDMRAGRRAAADRRLVRPGGSRRGHAALRARQPERADARRRHLAPGAGLHRPAHRGRRSSASTGNLPPIRAFDPV